LTKGALALYMKIMREFYVKYDSFDLDEKSITSKMRGQTLALTPSVIRDLYGMPKVSNSSFPFKGIRTTSKTQMSNLFIGPIGPKWIVNS